MLKHFSQSFAYLLLVLIPLQGIAAANMLVCNSMMQAQSYKQSNSQQVKLSHVTCILRECLNPPQTP